LSTKGTKKKKKLSKKIRQEKERKKWAGALELVPMLQ